MIKFVLLSLFCLTINTIENVFIAHLRYNNSFLNKYQNDMSIDHSFISSRFTCCNYCAHKNLFVQSVRHQCTEG